MNATKTRKISNSDDVIDSRDIIARIEELESEQTDLQATIDETQGDYDRDQTEDCADELAAARLSLREWNEENNAELNALRDLASQGEGYSDWKYGATLIRDSHFKTYAMDLADDIGAVPNGAAWPCTCIDWDKATRELQMDYTSIEFNDVTYWVR